MLSNSETLSLPDAAVALPPSGRPSTVEAAPAGLPDTRRIGEAAAGRLREAAAAGGVAEAAALRLLDAAGRADDPEADRETGPAALEGFCRRVALVGRPAGREGPVRRWSDALAPVFYDCAAEALAAGLVGEAAWGLVPLLQSPDTAPSGWLGLAVCAVRFGTLEDAALLALASRADGLGHPRAYYLQGFGALQAGNRKAAQQLLAAAARIARREPRFSEDLRMAQQLLLLLQLH